MTSTFTTANTLTLTGHARTTYEFQVVSVDVAGNAATSTPAKFKIG